MSLSSTLAIASSGLGAVQYQLAVASQNVANANTPGYVTEVANVASRQSGANGGGVTIKLTSRAVNDVMQEAVYSQNAIVSGLSVMTNALNTVSSVQGSTSADAGSSNTLSDNLGALQNSFTTIQSDPSNPTEQQGVVDKANALASSIRTLSGVYQAQRQNAQQAIQSELATLNAGLSSIGSLSQQIVVARVSGQQTADLENQRQLSMNTISQSLSLKFSETASGNMVVTTANGLILPTLAGASPLSTLESSVGVIDAYPGSIAPIKLDGVDVTSELTGGALGANIALRDLTFPTMQGELDGFASTLSSRFAAQGLTLFTDSSGNLSGSNPVVVPPNGQLGFSSDLTVNPAIIANPALVRDGNQAIQDPTAGAPIITGAVLSGAAAFTPNPPGGPVGFSVLISRVLDNTLGTTLMANTAQPVLALSGLGANGTLSAPYLGIGSLATMATTLTSSQAQTIAKATDQKTTQTDIQGTLQTSLASTSGVSVDGQMASVVALQNAYEANAKIISAIQSMFSALLAALP